MPEAEQIQLRHGTAAQWTVANPILSPGEVGVETDTYRAKIGDGSSLWTALPYIGTTVPISPTYLPNGITNFNTGVATSGTQAGVSTVVTATTKYYILGSQLALPAVPLTGLIANKSTFIWDVAMNKDAVSSGGAFNIIIFRGTTGTNADTADVTQSLGTLAASADNITLEVQLTVTTTGATGAYYWSIIPTHMGSGFGLVTGASGHFSGTVSSVALNIPSLSFGLGFSAATATPTIGIPQVQSTSYSID